MIATARKITCSGPESGRPMTSAIGQPRERGTRAVDEPVLRVEAGQQAPAEAQFIRF